MAKCVVCSMKRFMERFSLERGVVVSTEVSTFKSSVENLDPGRPGVALVSISRLQSLCETVAPRYAGRARFFSVREGYGAAVTALQAYVEAGAVDVVLAAGSNGAYLRDNLS